MKREFSLKGRKLFKEILKKGTRVQEEGIQLIVLNYSKIKSEKIRNYFHKNDVKIGILINKKHGNAFLRNKTKRKIRAIFNDLLQSFNSGQYLIIKPDENFRKLEHEQAKSTIKALLLKVGAIKSDNHI